VASLIFLRSRTPSVATAVRRSQRTEETAAWLRGSSELDPAARSLVFEVVTRLLFGVLMMASLYLLLAGHNWPGGGFAGGLVAGLALVVRYLAAGPRELADAAPFDAGRLLGLGLLVAVASALFPWVIGGRIFQSYELYLSVPTMPLLGSAHLVSSTVFDIGVYIIVLGMALDLIRSLGSGIDQHAQEERTPLPRPESTTALPARARREGER